MSRKDEYRKVCEIESTIPIFSQSWWLDATAGNFWDVVLVEKGGEIQASLPYTLRKKYDFTLLAQPQLTQSLGPWLKANNSKYAKRLGREKDLMQALIEQLPQYDKFSQNWSPVITNWLPFHWKGFNQTTRYTYRIESLTNLDMIWHSFQENIRREIRKASQREGLIVTSDVSIDDFITLNEKVFLRQGKELPYKGTLVRRIDQAAYQKNSRRMFAAIDSQGRYHAAVYIVWDNHSAYYLMGGSDPELRNSGATSLCMWEAVKFASTVTQSFDFEGSMIEPVERFFRAFGAVQTPYHYISHTPSKLLRTLNFFRSIKS
ncbi:GNAT family N-acetyltransferase [uncultured Endozoicomonas sp.]|uniref:GNAT family N-acetyltransferase n=1 Tax=uncultured Endozoicomonas sp. TaxID=432652 RepID=UPI00262D8E25|nr:GNAT family N-acetyltransferase [uncultured Endozoicomonas sp.]